MRKRKSGTVSKMDLPKHTKDTNDLPLLCSQVPKWKRISRHSHVPFQLHKKLATLNHFYIQQKLYRKNFSKFHGSSSKHLLKQVLVDMSFTKPGVYTKPLFSGPVDPAILQVAPLIPSNQSFQPSPTCTAFRRKAVSSPSGRGAGQVLQKQRFPCFQWESKGAHPPKSPKSTKVIQSHQKIRPDRMKRGVFNLNSGSIIP